MFGFSLFMVLFFILFCYRCYVSFQRASSLFNQFNEQVRLNNLQTGGYYFMSPNGTKLESNFCIVEIIPSKSVCYIIEKQLPYSDGYQCMEIKNSYKTNDLYSAIMEVFTPEMQYDLLKELCQLYEVDYLETYVAVEPKLEEKQEEVPAEEETMSMPVLKVEIDEPELDKEPDISYNDEREVDL